MLRVRHLSRSQERWKPSLAGNEAFLRYFRTTANSGKELHVLPRPSVQLPASKCTCLADFKGNTEADTPCRSIWVKFMRLSEMQMPQCKTHMTPKLWSRNCINGGKILVSLTIIEAKERLLAWYALISWTGLFYFCSFFTQTKLFLRV